MILQGEQPYHKMVTFLCFKNYNTDIPTPDLFIIFSPTDS